MYRFPFALLALALSLPVLAEDKPPFKTATPEQKKKLAEMWSRICERNIGNFEQKIDDAEAALRLVQKSKDIKTKDGKAREASAKAVVKKAQAELDAFKKDPSKLAPHLFRSSSAGEWGLMKGAEADIARVGAMGLLLEFDAEERGAYRARYLLADPLPDKLESKKFKFDGFYILTDIIRLDGKEVHVIQRLGFRPEDGIRK